MRCGAVTRQGLKRFMQEAFWANNSDGAWTMHDVYDALKAAQVMLLHQGADCPLLRGEPRKIFSALRALVHVLPTQTYRLSGKLNSGSSVRR
jgi:hypothetical protein